MVGAGDAFADARRNADGEWRGAAGSAFVGAMGRAVTESDQVGSAVTGVADTLEGYAASLQGCQDRMTTARATAAAGGLAVHGFIVENPGAGPANPGPPPDAASQGQVDAYNAQVQAWNDHQAKITAYNECLAVVEEIRTDIERAWERVSAQDRVLGGPEFAFTLSDIAGGLGGALVDVHTSALRGSAAYFGNLSAQYLGRLEQLAQNGRLPVSAAQYYDDLASYRAMAAGSADDLSRAARLANVGRFAPVAFGGALAGVGIWYDMEHGDEGAGQAVASNLGGFGASVATGAVVGTMIGGPVGTVAGTIVGAGVGVFTSGMIDGLWENDGDVGDAFLAGVDSVVDTGEAIGDLGGAVVDGIGGLFD